CLEAPDLKYIGPYREEGFRNARGLLHRQTLRHGKTMTLRYATVLGVAASGDQRTDARAELERCACAERCDFPCDLKSQNRRSTRRRCIFALPLQDVGSVDAGGVNFDKDFVLARQRRRHFTDA